MTRRRRPPRRVHCLENEYTAEQTCFLLGMDALKRRLGRQPAPAEVLREAIRLGYRKTQTVTLEAALRHLRRGD